MGILHLQAPGADTGHLVEALLAACAGADRGGAIFAWANTHGVTALLDAAPFRAFVLAGRFDLVVGTDSITDTPAVAALAARELALPNLSVRAFYHEQPNVIFHPKLAWFATAGRLRLVVGSGNLTRGGTRGNWEAFTVVDLTGNDAVSAEQELATWQDEHAAHLLPLDDARVAQRVQGNTGRERDVKRQDELPPPAPLTPSPTLMVLVAEIGRGDRWTQANFPRAIYEGFFGARVGTKGQVFLVPVRDDGSLGGRAVQPTVEVPSRNYRIELAAAGGAYPDDGRRPLGVFVRLETGDFRYQVIMPGDAGWAEADAFLTGRWAGPGRELRRVSTTVADLRAVLPASPLWAATTDEN